MFRTPTCPKCCGNFGAKDLRSPVGPNIPLLLYCGHTFCEGCLRRLAKQDQEKISCPSCKSETHLVKGEESVKHLPVDVYCLGSLLVNKRLAIISDDPKPQKLRKQRTKPEVVKKVLASDEVTPVQNGSAELTEKVQDGEACEGIQCEECRKLQATCKCLKCDITVCEDCFEKIHSASRTLSQHNSLPLSNLSTSSITCEEHGNKPLEFYDKDEAQSVCSHCFIMGKHQGHDIVPINEMCIDVEQSLNKAVSQAKNNLKVLKDLEKTIAGEHLAGKMHYEYLKQEVKEHFAFVNATLQIRELNVLKEIEEICCGERLTSSKKDNLLDEIKAITVTLKEAESLLQTPSKMIAYGQYVKDRLDELCESSLMETKNEMNHSLARVNTKSQVFDAISSHCEVIKDLLSTDSGFSLTNGIHETPSEILNGQQWKKGSSHLVYVTNIKDPLSFKIQHCSDVERLQIMMNKLNKYCKHSKSPDDKLDHVNQGDVVCAQFTADNAWYRAEVISTPSSVNNIEDKKIQVRYLDYGNVERLPMERLRRILPQFTSLPPLSKECALVGIKSPLEGEKWPIGTNKFLGSLTGDKAMLMVIVEDNQGKLEVELRRSENSSGEPSILSVSDALVFYGVAQYTPDAEQPLLCDPEAHKDAETSVHCQSLLYTKSTTEEFTNVMITHCVSPHKFYIQQVGKQSLELAKTMEDMGRVFSKSPHNIWDIPKPHPGMVCGAKFTEDNSWYRAIVTGVNGLNVDVFYVDFGNSETIPWSHIRSLPEKFRILSRQALCCSLVGTSPINSEVRWSDEAIAKFSNVALSKNMMMKVKDQTEEQLFVFLYDTSSEEDVCLNKLLVDEGLATISDPDVLEEIEKSLAKDNAESETASVRFKPPEIPSGDFELYITHVDDTGLIYGQQIKSGDQTVEQLMEVMQVAQFSESTDRIPDVTQLKIGQACCAQYSVDKRWYRASVLKHVDPQAFEVYFVDYGNTDRLDVVQLRLDMPFIEIPQQCVPCQLHEVKLPMLSVDGSTDISVAPQVIHELRRLLISQKCKATLQGDGFPLPVNLSCLVNVGGKEIITDLGKHLSETMDGVTLDQQE